MCNLCKNLYSTLAASCNLLTPLPTGLQSRRDVEDCHLTSACASSLSDARDKGLLLLHAHLLHCNGQHYLKRHPSKVYRPHTDLLSIRAGVDGQFSDERRVCGGSYIPAGQMHNDVVTPLSPVAVPGAPCASRAHKSHHLLPAREYVPTGQAAQASKPKGL